MDQPDDFNAVFARAIEKDIRSDEAASNSSGKVISLPTHVRKLGQEATPLLEIGVEAVSRFQVV
jgi:hypothetical protein